MDVYLNCSVTMPGGFSFAIQNTKFRNKVANKKEMIYDMALNKYIVHDLGFASLKPYIRLLIFFFWLKVISKIEKSVHFMVI